MTKILKYTFVIFYILSLYSCASNNKNKKDNSELYAKSQQVDAIIERSGTLMRGGNNRDKLREQMIDAENRLRTGGGIFGKKGGINLLDMGKGSQTTSASIGMPINPYLWKGSLEIIDFMPLMSTDPFSGVIITDWYSGTNDTNERCKINIFIKGVELKTQNLNVNSFCQKVNDEGSWIDQGKNIENNIKLENAILNKAKKIRLAAN